MSIIYSNPVKIIPINRGVETEVMRPSLNGMIGRFHGISAQVGDPSGGFISLTCDIPNLSTMFGNYALCEITMINLWMGSNTGGCYADLRILTGEASSAPTGLSLTWRHQVDFSRPLALYDIRSILYSFPKVYFRAAEQTFINVAQVQAIWYANLNTEQYWLTCYGNIYDERYM